MLVVQLEFWERKPSEARIEKACNETVCTIKHLIVEGQNAFVKQREDVLRTPAIEKNWILRGFFEGDFEDLSYSIRHCGEKTYSDI
jgi:hypothetical protein